MGSDSLAFKTKGCFEQPSNTSLLKSTIKRLSVTESNAYQITGAGEGSRILVSMAIAKESFLASKKPQEVHHFSSSIHALMSLSAPQSLHP